MKIIKVVLIFGVFLSAGPAFCAGEPAGGNKEAQQRYITGLKYFQAGNYEKADMEWRSASVLDPQNPDVKQGLERLKQLMKADVQSGVETANADARSTAAEGNKDAKVEAALPYGLVKGYRGTSIPIGGDQLLYLRKGDRVDVLVTFDAVMGGKDKKEWKEKITSTFLQNIVVINVRKPEKVEEAGAVELMLNPVEAQYAALAISQGSMHITVRAPGDVELHPMEMASFRKLIR